MDVFQIVHVIMNNDIIACKVIGESNGVCFDVDKNDWVPYRYIYFIPIDPEESMKYLDGKFFSCSFYGDKETYKGFLYERDVYEDQMTAYFALNDEKLRHPELFVYLR